LIYPNSDLLFPFWRWCHFPAHANRHSYVGRPGRWQEDNIKIDYKEIGWGYWNGLIWLRTWKVAGFCEQSKELFSWWNKGNFLTVWGIIGSWMSTLLLEVSCLSFVKPVG
jgi:hypothetical protein